MLSLILKILMSLLNSFTWETLTPGVSVLVELIKKKLLSNENSPWISLIRILFLSSVVSKISPLPFSLIAIADSESSSFKVKIGPVRLSEIWKEFMLLFLT